MEDGGSGSEGEGGHRRSSRLLLLLLSAAAHWCPLWLKGSHTLERASGTSIVAGGVVAGCGRGKVRVRSAVGWDRVSNRVQRDHGVAQRNVCRIEYVRRYQRNRDSPASAAVPSPTHPYKPHSKPHPSSRVPVLVAGAVCRPPAWSLLRQRRRSRRSRKAARLHKTSHRAYARALAPANGPSAGHEIIIVRTTF